MPAEGSVSRLGSGRTSFTAFFPTLLFFGAIAVFVDVGSSSSRWFRRREGRSRVFCFPTKEMNHEERLGKSPFTGLPNVKGTVAEDARITDSPPRSEPVLEIRVRPRAGMLRCSRCGRRCRGHDQGGGVRRRGRFRAVGRAGQPVHARLRVGVHMADERRVCFSKLASAL